MFNRRDNHNHLSRILINDDSSYNNLYDYIEQLFLVNNKKINNIRVDIENDNILTILLDINSTHNKEFFVKHNNDDTYKIIIVSHYYENSFSLTKTLSERIISKDSIVFPELLVLLEEYFNNPEL